MPDETSKERQKRYTSAKAQQLLKEHGSFIQDIVDECIREYSSEINEESTDATVMKYKHNQGARQALTLFMKKLNSKAND